MENTFRSKKNLVWFPGKCFPFIFGGKHFPEVMKNLGPVCLLESSFLLESEFQENEFPENELFFDVW